jgi:hypothetical protein
VNYSPNGVPEGHQAMTLYDELPLIEIADGSNPCHRTWQSAEAIAR